MTVSTQAPSTSAFAFMYEHCDIPEGITLDEHRASARHGAAASATAANEVASGCARTRTIGRSSAD